MRAGESAGDEVERSLQLAAEHRRKAEHWEQRAAAFAQGQHGELAVAAVLSGMLPNGYVHLDDVRFPGSRRANVDHVVVGPAGVLVVDAKEWSGTVTLRDGVLRQNGYRRQEKIDVVESACQAVATATRLSPSLFTSVICMTGTAQLTAPGTIQATTVLSLRDLPAWLESRPPLLHSPGEVEVVIERLRGSLTSAGNSSRRPTQATSGSVHRHRPGPPLGELQKADLMTPRPLTALHD